MSVNYKRNELILQMQLCYYYTLYFSAIVKTVLVPSDALVNCFTSTDCTSGQVGSMSIPALECCVNNSGTTFLFDGGCRLCFG